MQSRQKGQPMPANLLRASVKLEECKLRINTALTSLDAYISSPSAGGAPRFPDDGSVSESQISCNLCGRGECSDDDDILMCDGRLCFRAYHTSCLGIVGHEEWDEDEVRDWVCVGPNPALFRFHSDRFTRHTTRARAPLHCLFLTGDSLFSPSEQDWQCVWCELRGEMLEIVNDYFPVDGRR